MENKPFLTIAIPTYNRAIYLKNLLNCIVPQAEDLCGLVQICISNNSSTDNTREIIADFKKKYIGLIKDQENEKNFGAHINFLKVMEMSDGDFVWLLGDDDLVADNGIKKVIDFIKNQCDKDIGLIALASESYFWNKNNGKKTVYSDTIEKNKLKTYKIDREDIIMQRFPAAVFISILLFNNNYLKKILEEEKTLVRNAIKAREYIHTFLYRLMFLKYPNLHALRLNEIIIQEEVHYYKFFIEDVFQLHYITWTKLNDLLFFCKYTNDYYKKLIIEDKNKATKNFIVEMGLMKCFKSFNYSSFFNCIGMFFKNSSLLRALLFSVFFVIFYIIPSIILRNLYKIFIKIRHKKRWKDVWRYITIKNYEMSMGDRRLIC